MWLAISKIVFIYVSFFNSSAHKHSFKLEIDYFQKRAPIDFPDSQLCELHNTGVYLVYNAASAIIKRLKQCGVFLRAVTESGLGDRKRSIDDKYA